MTPASRIGVDCDGPLLNWRHSFHEYVLRHHGIDLSPQDMKWNPITTAPALAHLDSSLREAMVADYCSSHPSRLEDADAPEALRQLQGRGHEVALVTHRVERAELHTVQLLRGYGITFHRHVFGHHRAKVGYDVLIDDTLRHLEDNVASGGRGILYTQVHNEDQAVPRNVIRTDTWSEIPRLVDELLAVA
jgi:hypothetical protein